MGKNTNGDTGNICPISYWLGCVDFIQLFHSKITMNTFLLFLIFASVLIILWKVHKIEKSIVQKDNYHDDYRYKEAVALLKDNTHISVDLLQEKLGVGYTRAARMVDNLEKEKLIEPGDMSKSRKVL